MYEIAKIKQLANAPALLMSSKTTLLSTMLDFQFQGGGDRIYNIDLKKSERSVQCITSKFSKQ